MSLRSLLAAAIASVAMAASATPQPIDATGLWVNPDELGWGISVYHQGDTLFASLFVYAPDGTPKWYTASSLTGGPNQYSGLLTESTGPFLGAGSFDAGSVTRRTVGAMRILLNDAGRGSVNYSVDGTEVSRPISKLTIRPVNMSANYIGAEVDPDSGPEVLVLDQHINIDDPASYFNIFTDSNRTGGCSYYSTSRSQSADAVIASGNGKCGPGQPTDSWAVTLDPTPHGFTGTVNWIGPTGQLSNARIAAAKRTAPSLQGTGYINDLWFPPNESGWGLNLIEQGDTAFATLFVYDAQNRPHWYSASRLIGTISDGRPYWSGNLEESTGPYFGSTFYPYLVNRRTVGAIGFRLDENGDGLLSYTIDGRSLVKIVKRFGFRKNDLSGNYQGSVLMRPDDPRGSGSYDDATISIDDQGDRVNMHIEILTGPKCDYAGQSIQYGAQRSVYGTYACAGGAQGRFEMNDLMVTAQGFTGTYQGPAGHIGGLITNGHISGARR